MTIAYACDCYVMCVRISGRNSFKGGECKTREKSTFSTKGQNSNLSL